MFDGLDKKDCFFSGMAWGAALAIVALAILSIIGSYL